MAEITKVALKVDNNNSFPNNNGGLITPAILRAFNVNMIDSMVDEIPFGAYTQSVNTSLNALNVFTASATGLSTGSLLVTASAAGNVITFTKGNNTTFNVTVATGSVVDISNLNQATASLQSFTASAQVSINNLNTTTASLNISVSNINTFTASTAISITNLNASSASQQVSINALNTYTASQSTASLVTSITNLNTFSASALVSISNLNASSASQQVSIDALNTNSASVNTSISALNTFTASQSTASLVTSITNLNTFSASALVSISNINSTTASLNTSVTNINSATASLFTSASLALVTASFDTGTRNLTFTKGNTTQFSVNIPDVSGSAGTFVTTSSFNAYTQSNDQRVTALEVNSASVNTSIANINTTTASLNTSVSALNTFTASQSTASLVTSINNLNTFSASALVSISNLNTTTQSLNTSVTNLNSATASLFGSASLSLYTASAVGNTITFTKGDTSTFSVSVTATPIDTGSLVTTASFNAYTSSTNSRLNNIETTTASLNTSVSNLNTFSASALVSISNLNTTTASLNTSVTNLNQFTASATESVVTAIVTNNGSNYYIIDGVNQPKLSFVPGPKYRFDLSGIVGSHPFKFSTTANGPTEYTTCVTSGSNFIQIEVGYDTTTPLYYYCTNHSGMGNEINVLGIEKLLTTASFNAYTSSNDAKVNSLISATGSFATTGSNTFRGNQNISGSLTLTGSAFGNVVSMSITSNTASMDLSLGNYFTLTLAGTATTHISASNVQPGVSATLVITTGTNSSASLAPTMLQPSGSAYSATAGSGKKDVLSIVAVSTGVPFVVSTLNMI